MAKWPPKAYCVETSPVSAGCHQSCTLDWPARFTYVWQCVRWRRKRVAVSKRCRTTANEMLQLSLSRRRCVVLSALDKGPLEQRHSRGGGGGGARGPCPSPKLLVNFPINLRCYVLLCCRVKNVISACLKNQY